MSEENASFTHLQSPLPGQIAGKTSFSVGSSIVSDQPRPNTQRTPRNPLKPTIWMQKPTDEQNTPPGLEYLVPLSGLYVVQDLPSPNGENRYHVKNLLGERIFNVNETYYGNMRTGYGKGYGAGYILQFFDRLNNEVMRLSRPSRVNACCWCAGKSCDSCSHVVIVEASNQIIGYVGQSSSCWKPYLNVMDPTQHKRFRIKGPCCFDVDSTNKFEIFTSNYGTYAGNIYNTANDENYNTESNNNLSSHYGVQFPQSINVECKATILAALFLIDSMFYESKIVDS